MQAEKITRTLRKIIYMWDKHKLSRHKWNLIILLCASVNDLMGIVLKEERYMVAGCFILLAAIYANTIRRD